MQKRTEDIIKLLAVKYELTEREVLEIVRSQDEFIVGVMKSAVPGDDSTFKNVRKIAWGVYHVKPGRLYILNKRKKNGRHE